MRAARAAQTRLRTLPVLLLGGIIDNQNSDFVSDNWANEARILIFNDPAEQED
jgi:hypothetical protein